MKITGPALSGINLPSKVKLSPDLEKAIDIKQSDKSSFGEMLNEKIKNVDQLQKAADVAVTDFSTGKSKNLHEAVLALEMADTSLKMIVTVRNKALEAYQDIMKMPI
ncbi:MAG: flagellar hook-basal body complex protein FliE [Deltaproteobacteria bacterium]|nr:flagellar hook-basal body complex protein FliE [Deltaproteobacteria bacterium]